MYVSVGAQALVIVRIHGTLEILPKRGECENFWYNEVVPKNRHPHLRLKHRRADAEHIARNKPDISFFQNGGIHHEKISKRFLTLAITCVMAMAMAVPAFADWTIEVDDNSNRYINVYGTYGSSLNMRYLTLYKTSAPKSEQCFHLYRSSGFGDNFVLCASTNSQYAMNRNSNNGRAWLWSLSNNGYGDSRLKTPQSDSSTLLVSYRYGTIGVSGSNVIFGASGASWFASGTPEFPLSTTNVDINPYL